MRGRHLLVPLLVAASVVAASLSQAAATPPRAASGAQSSPASGAQPSPVSERVTGATPSAAVSSGGVTDSEPRPPWQVLCDGTGVDGPRIEVVYSRDSNHPDRLGDVAPVIRSILAETDRIYYLSAARGTEGRQIRFETEPDGAGCRIAIKEVVVPPGASDGGANPLPAWEAAGLLTERKDRLDVIFQDGTYPGAPCQAQLTHDDQPGPSNAANVGERYAQIPVTCWSVYGVAHEIGHLLGAVQPSAPHATPGGHCTQLVDVMCYDDGTAPTTSFSHDCTATLHNPGGFLDCGDDDYYSTAPAGTYLPTHWNVANSVFLEPVPGLPTAAPSVVPADGDGQTVLPDVPFTLRATASTPAGRFLDAGLRDWEADTNGPSGEGCHVLSSDVDTAVLSCEGGGADYGFHVRHDVVDNNDRSAEADFNLTMHTPSPAPPTTLTATPDSTSAPAGSNVHVAVALRGQAPGDASPTTALGGVVVSMGATAGGRSLHHMKVRTDAAGVANFAVPVAETEAVSFTAQPSTWARATARLSLTAEDPAPLPPPPSLVAATANDGAISVTWLPSGGAAPTPVAAYTLVADPGGHEISVPSTATSATVPDLQNGVAYTVRLWATNDAGDGPAASIDPLTPIGPPDPVSNVLALGGSTAAWVDWTAPESDGGSGMGSYTVTAEPGGQTLYVEQPFTSTYVYGLLNGTSYTFTVTASNITGVSAPASSNPVVPAGAPDPPATAVAVAGNTRVLVGWSQSANDNAQPVTSYLVMSSFQGMQSVTGRRWIVWPYLSNGKQYWFRVAACNAVGCGRFGPRTNVVTPHPPR